jgi:putative radical SAM enzyme (TIGR03279 family)
MKIVGIRPGSPASRLELSPGDDLHSINGLTVNDHIDYAFYSADEELELVITSGGETATFNIIKQLDEDAGLDFGPMPVRVCGDNCIFCFIHQNPEGVRESLLLQDEDYRHSFLHGNYITLDNLSEADFSRIVEMKLSPLYVSVHTTDPDLREKMLRSRRSGQLISRLERLLDGDIQIYAQIVLVPDWNDGPHLKKTLFDLAEYHPGILSVAVVPVGLTDHRQGLPELRRLSPEEMHQVIDECEQWRHFFQQKHGSPFVFLSDEFFLASGTPLPVTAWYEGSDQEENGVGLAAHFVEEFLGKQEELREVLKEKQEAGCPPLRIVACTGEMGMEMFRRHLIGILEKMEGLDFRLIETPNTFFGGRITTAGLLTAQCFAAALEGEDLSQSDALLLPPNSINNDGLFLDDIELQAFSQSYPCTVEKGSYSLTADILNISGRTTSTGTGAE